MAGVVHIPWYATVLRHQSFGEAVAEISPVATRYGATKYQVHRSLDDRYKILQMLWFESKDDWYRFWESPQMIEFRARNAGHYQIPVVYYWHDELVSGPVHNGNGNGHDANGHAPKPTPELEPHTA